MFGRVVSNLCRDRYGLTVVASAIGVLTGIESILTSRNRAAKALRNPVTPEPIAQASAREPLRQRFKITQTRSELGYVYWVVRDSSANPSYALFDSWREAMDEVANRLNVAAAQQLESSLVHA
jgi:hypothetical protein